jgi:chaperonin GroES
MTASLCAGSMRTNGPLVAVVAVGPGVADDKGQVQPLDVQVGDRVLFGKWSGTEVKIDGDDVLIMKESDILGVLEGATASKKKAA